MDDPDQSPVVLLLVDVINAFDFEGCEPLVAAAKRVAPKILALRERAHAAGVPVIYVNDNFGQWRSDFHRIVDACSKTHQPGHDVTRLLVPAEEDYFVLKPRHSAFYCTALELLLERMAARTLIICGFAANICVLFSANDAHMRGYQIVVPEDCTAANSDALTEQALEQLRTVANARTDASVKLDLAALRYARPAGGTKQVA